ncbi:MAG: hypothetical protein LBR19_06220, partial [Bifidobacteriaceae bacterium]|nr:hypothetical protein [Bifidobacteriaceae bacterium]
DPGGQPRAGGALEMATWDLDPGGQPRAGGALEMATWDLDPGGQPGAGRSLGVSGRAWPANAITVDG